MVVNHSLVASAHRKRDRTCMASLKTEHFIPFKAKVRLNQNALRCPRYREGAPQFQADEADVIMS